jgi:photosystem II stability/assembly factor-like uncharacterized protein
MMPAILRRRESWGMSMNTVRRTLVGLAMILLPALALAGSAGPEERAGDPLRGLDYRLIGPALGGRVARVAGVPGDPLRSYAATAAGGVWRSTNGGADWKPVFDNQPVSSIGSIAVAPSDPNVVWVGSGEANIRGNVAEGNGIYRSTDGGATWTRVWSAEAQIGTIIVHPQDPGVAFAAVLGSPFGPGPERGVYRTTDGGATWQRVLFVDADTGASDVCFDPANPRILFAGFWQARRQPWTMTSGGPGSGLYVSRDGGDSWRRLEGKGLPAAPWGKVGVRVAPSDSRRVYALIEASSGGLFRSDDGGESWALVNASRGLRQRAWYYTTLSVDRDADTVWSAGPMPVDRRRPRRALSRAARLTTTWIGPPTPAPDRRQRRLRFSRRRRDLGAAADPDHAVLPRDGRQPRAVPGARQRAGPRHRVRTEQQPSQWRCLALRLAPGGRRRGRPRGCRSERPGDRLGR